MSREKNNIVVAVVKNFDPNRPDLQKFLNKLAADALGEKPQARKRKVRARSFGKPRSRRQRGR